MKILNFGSANVDYVYSLDHIVTVGETENSQELSIFPGGKGLNQSIALARADAQVFHAGCIGADGEILSNILAESGVDISFVRFVPEKNGHAIIQVSREGENAIFLHAGSNAMIAHEHVDEVLSHFGEGDLLLLQNEISNLDYIVKGAAAIGMRILLNPSPYNERIESLDLSLISYLILNEVEGRAITGEEETEKMLDWFFAHFPHLAVMLTLGKQGCVLSHEGERLRHPAYLVDAVDTTAAGDTFTGYFVAGLAAEEDLRTILKNASCASAIAVSRNGAAPSIPVREEVLAKRDALCLRTENREEHIRERTEKYIAANLQTATLSGLAATLGYSDVYAGSLVKKSTGCSFKELLQKRRLAVFARALTETDAPIEVLIKQVGYENGGFFRRVFFEKYGKNPLEYRKTVRGERT
ncbi:MAG: helix-turn-helix domain-containing protein [Clostridia bacterium]|nr:helix-turn-helix domain-containing protein [Clostridia bacterium]